MGKALNSGCHGRAVKCGALWRQEIISAFIICSCVVAGFQRLWLSERHVLKKTADFRDRLSFIKRYSSGKGRFVMPGRRAMKADASEVIAAIRQAAHNRGAAIDRLAVGSEVVCAREHLSLLPVEFSVVLPQEALVSFVQGLKETGFLFRVVSLNVRPDPSDDGRLLLSSKAERVNFLSAVKAEDLKKFVSDIGPDNQRIPGTFASGKKIFRNILKPARRVVEPPDKSELNLVGVIDDGQAKAIIEDRKTSKTYHLVAGDEIDGQRVVEISDREVVLEKQEGERRSLAL